MSGERWFRKPEAVGSTPTRSFCLAGGGRMGILRSRKRSGPPRRGPPRKGFFLSRLFPVQDICARSSVWTERRTTDAEAGGSNPSGRTEGSMVAEAQMVERRVVAPEVASSSLVGHPDAPWCNLATRLTLDQESGGSRPSGAMCWSGGRAWPNALASKARARKGTGVQIPPAP